MKLPLASLMIQEREGRTGANRAEDWSARPSQERESHQCCGHYCGAGVDSNQMDAAEPTEKLEHEEVESSETTRGTNALEATGPEDQHLSELSFAFVASSDPVDACARRGDGLEALEMEADCRPSPAGLRHLGHLRRAPASVCSAQLIPCGPATFERGNPSVYGKLFGMALHREQITTVAHRRGERIHESQLRVHPE